MAGLSAEMRLETVEEEMPRPSRDHPGWILEPGID